MEILTATDLGQEVNPDNTMVQTRPGDVPEFTQDLAGDVVVDATLVVPMKRYKDLKPAERSELRQLRSGVTDPEEHKRLGQLFMRHATRKGAYKKTRQL